MRSLSVLPVACRAAVPAALVVAGVLAPLAYAPIVWLVLAAYLYMEFTVRRAQLLVLRNVFLAVSLPLLFAPLVGIWTSQAFVLPVIPLLDSSLRRSALGYRLDHHAAGRRLTMPCLSLLAALLVTATASVGIQAWGLLLSCGLVAGYFVALIALVLRSTSAAPVHATPLSYKVVAGSAAEASVTIVNVSRLPGRLAVHSSYPWFHVRQNRVALSKPELDMDVHFSPPLAGPTKIVVPATFLDPWGLLRMDFDLDVLQLLVIPRAKYARWLANRYLEQSRAGGQDWAASLARTATRPSHGGVEFYGLRPYQAGDSAKLIDWKHSLKLHQWVVKEFLDARAERAVLAVNLSINDVNEEDLLAHSLIMTVLTLAREGIPLILSAYNHDRVVLTTPVLGPRQAVLQALDLANQITMVPSPLRYLDAPDVSRLRGNIRNLNHSGEAAAIKLAELLKFEYSALGEIARRSPATQAFDAALGMIKTKPIILVLSAHNHDAEAVALGLHALKEKGYQALVIGINGSRFDSLASNRLQGRKHALEARQPPGSHQLWTALGRAGSRLDH
ncbi:MAG: DUF58 domain-containing protein [Chloroflexi bacterium]|nr:DUF58 domain-containing protein [Chloroflexota bacterium]